MDLVGYQIAARGVHQSTTDQVPFGIVVDGSTFSDRHFVAIFAMFNDPIMCSGNPAHDDPDYFKDTKFYNNCSGF
ncbi:hypothetical protein F443_19697 [Phytophthora nicotianae P1569]|uniref:Uncharacterized protein n=5 Tax=Phytophthora nicotianae TaxID=4792 RepID=V9E3W3_PHYNI|nr:hypothetical protein F443_19697 [Phytophthora nicotianae P1569]